MLALYLRTFTPKMFPRTDFVLNLPHRKVMMYFCQKGKKWDVTDLILERTCPEEHPKSEKNRAFLANKATVSVSSKIVQLDL